MTALSHYQRAENLMAEVRKARAVLGGVSSTALSQMLAEAQVYATLALADATWSVAGRTGGE